MAPATSMTVIRPAARRHSRAEPGPRQRLLSRTAEYALRALSALASAGGGPLTALELSPKTRIPPHYLSKVLRQLVSHGIVRSRRGHGGGFTLSRSAEDITFAQVLEAVGSSPAIDRCAFGWGRCNARRPCVLHPAWSRLNGAFLAWARTTTLGDVTRGV